MRALPCFIAGIIPLAKGFQVKGLLATAGLDVTHCLYANLDTERGIELVPEDIEWAGISSGVIQYEGIKFKTSSTERRVPFREQQREDGGSRGRNEQIALKQRIQALGASNQWRELVTEIRTAKVVQVKTFSIALNTLSRRRQWRAALELFEERERKGEEMDLICWSSVIDALGKSGQWRKAEQILRRMKREGPQPNVIVYNSMLNSYSKGGVSDKSLDLFDEMKAKGVTPTVQTFGCLIDAQAKRGKVQTALRLFEEMKKSPLKRDVTIYGSLIDACAQAGDWQKAMDILLVEIPKDGVEANLLCYNSALHSCSRPGRWKEALLLLDKIRDDANLKPDVYSYTSAIRACIYSADNQWETGVSLYYQMMAEGIKSNSYSYDACLDAYARGGKVEEAYTLLSSMREEGLRRPGVTNYNSILRACVKTGLMERAKELVHEMRKNSIKPDTITETILRRGGLKKTEVLEVIGVGKVAKAKVGDEGSVAAKGGE